MIVFQNKGLIDLRGITTFGVCVKPETKNPIGYFGTGLKYAIAVMLREGIKVTLYRGKTACRFTTKKRKIRDQQFHMVQMNGEDLPFTTELGRNWGLWMAYRELAANAMDEPDNVVTSDKPVIKSGYTTFVVEGNMIDAIHNSRHEIFLVDSVARYTFDTVELHDGVGVGKYLYYRGIRVFELPKQSMYNYNILSEVKLTEDRTLPSIYTAYRAIAAPIVACDHAGLIRQMLEANSNWWESTIDYDLWVVKPGETFNMIVKHYHHSGRSYNTSAKDLYRKQAGEVPPPKLVQWEAIPMENRRKLWAALQFWAKLGIGIPREMVRVTDQLGKDKGTLHAGIIYLSLHVLDRDMRQVSGIIYSLWARQKHGKHNDDLSLMIDTVVDFGERILGLKAKAA